MLRNTDTIILDYFLCFVNSKAIKWQKGGSLVYEKIKKLADERGISIYDLEKKAGLKNGAIGKWRKSSPTITSLQKVADALEVPITKLVEKE